MKLLFVIVNLEKGGAQRVMLNLCNALNYNHTIEIIVLRESDIGYPADNLRIRNLNDIRLKNRFIRFILNRNQLKKILKEGKYDGVISFLPEPNFMVCSIKDKAFKIINVRNDPTIEYQGIYHTLMRYFYPKANHCVVQTEKIKHYFEPYIRELSIIPNPVSDIQKHTIERKPIILNAGRLVPQKNQKLLIQAFKTISETYPNYECHIYGDGHLKSELNELITQFELSHKIKLFQPDDLIFKHMQEAEIFVLSSDYEGYPNVLLESMVCGCAVISTDCASGGPSAIIQNEVNGLLVPVKDEKALVNAIIKCMDEKIRQRLIENARSIEFDHSNAKFLMAYTTIIESLENQHVKS